MQFYLVWNISDDCVNYVLRLELFTQHAAAFMPAPQQQRSVRPLVRLGMPVAPRPVANTTVGGGGAPALPASTPVVAGQP
jgi:hypothetical protein